MPPLAEPTDFDDEPMPPWRMLLDPRGRIGRAGFWRWGVGLPLGVALLLHALLGIARVPREDAELAVNLLLMWPVVAVSAKRWHDRDKSGWWVLIVLVPVVGWIWALVDNGFLRGSQGANRFGADPLDPATLSSVP
jgi:uncharacterized membrane protein YhaH (DUF805 family)